MLSCQDTEDTRYQPQQHTKHMLDGFKILSQANVEILKRCRISKRRQCFINQFLHRGELGGGGRQTTKKTQKNQKNKAAFRLLPVYYLLGHGFVATVLFCFSSLFHRLEVEQRCNFSIAISSKRDRSCSILLIYFFNLSFITPVKISWL